MSWARVQRVRRGSISSALLMYGGGVRIISLLPLVAICPETIDVCIWRMFVLMSVVVNVWWSGVLNPDTTTCTLLFAPDPVEYTSSLDLKIHNKALPMAPHPKVLGLTLDPKLTYSIHIHKLTGLTWWP